jgi:short-subunit dehydrogenase
VDTPMTASFKKGFLWVKPSLVAEKIIQAIDQRKDEVYVPAFWLIIMQVIKIVPNSVFRKLWL